MATAVRLGARHRAFVRHEMQPRGCAVLNALPCPVLNRMPPRGGSTILCIGRISRRRSRGSSASPFHPTATDRVGAARGYTPSPHPPNVCQRLRDWKASPAIDPTLRRCNRILGTRGGLAQWQHATGIGFARSTFVRRSGYPVSGVEPLPAMGRAPERLLDGVSRRVAEALA